MGDVVQTIMERMLPEVEDLITRSIFTKVCVAFPCASRGRRGSQLYTQARHAWRYRRVQEEVKAILNKRREFEYLLRKRVPVEADYVRYIEYELALESLRRKRKARMGLRKTTVSDHAGLRRIHFIFDRALRHFRGSTRWWMQWIDFSASTTGGKAVDRVCARALQLHPRCEELWLRSAAWHYDVMHSVRAARALLHRGLRINKTSKKLWLAFFRLECVEAMHARGRSFLAKLTASASATEPLISAAALAGVAPTEADEDDKAAADTAFDASMLATVDGPRLHETVDELLHASTDDAGDGGVSAALTTAKIVYDHAVRAIPEDLTFRVDLLEVCDSFRDTLSAAAAVSAAAAGGAADDGAALVQAAAAPAFPDLAAHIMSTIATDFATSPAAWKCLAVRPLRAVKAAARALLPASRIAAKDGVAELSDADLFVLDTGDKRADDGHGDQAPVSAVVERAPGGGSCAKTTTVMQFGTPSAETVPATDQSILRGETDRVLAEYVRRAACMADDWERPEQRLPAGAMHVPVLPSFEFDVSVRAVGGVSAMTPSDAATPGKKRRRDTSSTAPAADASPRYEVCCAVPGRKLSAAEMAVLNAASTAETDALAAMNVALSVSDCLDSYVLAAEVHVQLLQLPLPECYEAHAMRLKLLALIDALCAKAVSSWAALAAADVPKTPDAKLKRASDHRRAALLLLLRVQCLLRTLRVNDALLAVREAVMPLGSDNVVWLTYAAILAHGETIANACDTSLRGTNVAAGHKSTGLSFNAARAKSDCSWAELLHDFAGQLRACTRDAASPRAHATAWWLLVLPAHASVLDPDVLLAALRSDATVAARSFLRRAWLRRWFTLHGAEGAKLTAACGALIRVLTQHADHESWALALHLWCRHVVLANGSHAAATTRRIFDTAVAASCAHDLRAWQLYLYAERCMAADGTGSTARDVGSTVYSRAVRALPPALQAEFASSAAGILPGSAWEAAHVLHDDVSE